MFRVCSTEELFLCLVCVGWHWTARCHAENIAGARRLVVIIVQANSFAALVEVTPHKHDKLSFACLAAFKICFDRWQQCVHEYRRSSIMSNKFAALVEVTSHKSQTLLAWQSLVVNRIVSSFGRWGQMHMSTDGTALRPSLLVAHSMNYLLHGSSQNNN